MERQTQPDKATAISPQEQSISGIDPSTIAALAKAVDFLFDRAGNFIEEQPKNRKQLQEGDDTRQPNTTIVTKEDIKFWRPKNIYLKDIPKEIEHHLNLIEQYRRNKRIIEQSVAKSGGIEYASVLDQNQLLDTEDNIKVACQKLKDLVEECYGRKIAIIGLD